MLLSVRHPARSESDRYFGLAERKYFIERFYRQYFIPDVGYRFHAQQSTGAENSGE